MCCKLIEIEGVETDALDLDKEAGEWCRKWDRQGGCTIYATRPEVCRKFNCLWKLGQLPEELKPDKVKAVLAVYKEGVLICYVDPAMPDAYRKGNLRRFLSGWPTRFVVRIGKHKYFANPEDLK